MLHPIDGQPVLQPGFYFHGEPEAEALRQDGARLQLPHIGAVSTRFQWRFMHALRQLGWENRRISEARIDAAQFRQIEAELAARERLFLADAARLPEYARIWAPQFKSNLPREYGVHLMVRVLDLFNQGSTKYQTVSNSCLLANVLPMMRGAVVNQGTVDGSSLFVTDPKLRDPQTVQMPELFGFYNRRDAIGASELPPVQDVGLGSCSYAQTLVHEFAHDADQLISGGGAGSNANVQFNRLEHCSPHTLDFQAAGTPFRFDGAPGTQKLEDYISGYAAGLNSGDKTYIAIEDAAESVTAYLLFPEYFRELAAKSPALQARYDYLKTRLFGGTEFRNLAVERGAFKADDGSYSVSRSASETVGAVCRGFAEFRLDDIVKR